MRLLIGLGPDAEQGGDGELGQSEALAEGGGQEPGLSGAWTRRRPTPGGVSRRAVTQTSGNRWA